MLYSQIGGWQMDLHFCSFLDVVHTLFQVAFDALDIEPQECSGEIAGDTIDITVAIGDDRVFLNGDILAGDLPFAIIRKLVVTDEDMDEMYRSIA